MLITDKKRGAPTLTFAAATERGEELKVSLCLFFLRDQLSLSQHQPGPVFIQGFKDPAYF